MFAYRARMRAFNEEIGKLQARSVTRAQLLDVFNRIYRRGYNTGYQAGVAKWQPADGGVRL